MIMIDLKFQHLSMTTNIRRDKINFHFIRLDPMRSQHDKVWNLCWKSCIDWTPVPESLEKNTVILIHLHNYFNLHVCPSFRRRRRRRRRCRRRPTFDFQISAVISESVTNKSCLICVKSEKYAFLGTTRPLGCMRWGEAKLHTLWH